MVLSALWLVAAATAQVWYHSVPSGYEWPSHTALQVWLGVGIAGAALTLVSLLWQMRSVGRGRGKTAQSGRSLWFIVLAGCVGAAAEVALVNAVTDHAVSTAPLGYNNSGEGGLAIAVLAVVQPALVGALALAWHLLVPGSRKALGHRAHGPVTMSRLVGLAGMVITCVAFAAWSISDGTTLIVNTSLIAGAARMTNVGAWWPALFAAMSALAVVALACAPGVLRGAAAGGDEPVASPTNEDRAAAAPVGN